MPTAFGRPTNKEASIIAKARSSEGDQWVVLDWIRLVRKGTNFFNKGSIGKWDRPRIEHAIGSRMPRSIGGERIIN